MAGPHIDIIACSTLVRLPAGSWPQLGTGATRLQTWAPLTPLPPGRGAITFIMVLISGGNSGIVGHEKIRKAFDKVENSHKSEKTHFSSCVRNMIWGTILYAMIETLSRFYVYWALQILPQLLKRMFHARLKWAGSFFYTITKVLDGISGITKNIFFSIWRPVRGETFVCSYGCVV